VQEKPTSDYGHMPQIKQKKCNKSIFIGIALFLGALLFNNFSHADTRYLLCGSDEDGCYDYHSCACIPYNEAEGSRRFCLDLDIPRCVPLAEAPDCYALFIHRNQEECLATLYQSQPKPACQLVSKTFCLDNHIAICGADGNFNSCASQ
jgi:hypothetical protein